jgi:DNA-directed RNA polymerase subunit RPC12/RpoP
MKERISQLESWQRFHAGIAAPVVLPKPAAPTLVRRRPEGGRRADTPPGIEVGEAELGLAETQTLYRLTCECGRHWFELQQHRLVQCPACAKVCLVKT